MRLIFYFKVLRSICDVGFIITAKNGEKTFCFLDNCILIGCYDLSILQREYLPLAVTVLTNSPKIANITKIDISQLNFSQSDEKI